MAERVECLYRVSTLKQVDYNEHNQADIPMQRTACHEFADRMGWTIVREEQEDGVSGFKVHAADRDKLQIIKQDAREGKFDEKGIKTRKGTNWHDATVGSILHHVLYKGVLKSGKTYSEPFPELQIIDPYTFDLAQRVMNARAKEVKEKRDIPLNTTGQSLLSGNIFCGHCGGRLVLTTNAIRIKLASGKIKSYRRIRYICYNKTRHRKSCAGQTGYTMHIVDDAVINILHQIFDRMSAASDTMIIGVTQDRHMAELQATIKRGKAENIRVSTEYESFKAEVVKAVQGMSKMPMDVLSELVKEKRDQVIAISELDQTESGAGARKRKIE